MALTDTHCHLDFQKFDEDRAAVIERAEAAGLVRILIPGLSVTSSLPVVKLAESHPMLFAAVGVHPTETSDIRLQTLDELRKIATHAKVKAIGEIGLDYYWDAAPHEIQRQALRTQLDLAAELELPVVIHLREKDDALDGSCAKDAMSIIEAWAGRLLRSQSPLAERPGVLHSFAGSLETARRGISLNFLIGITGPVTFKNARMRQEVVAQLPLESLLIETDAPFLTPHPRRGKRNEPAFVREIADKIAQLHSRNLEEVAEITTANAERLFSWGEKI